MEDRVTPVMDRSIWSLGAAWDMQKQIIDFGYSVWAKGDYVQDRFLLNKDCLFVFHPDGLEHVLQKKYVNYTKNVSMFTALKVLLGEGLTTSEGSLWLGQRRMIQPFFQRAKVDAFVPVMIERVAHFLDEVRPGNEVEMQLEMDKLTLSISVRTLFCNTSFDDLAFIHDLHGISEDITSYIRFPLPPIDVPTPRNVRLKRKIALIDRHIWKVIAERREKPIEGPLDILQTLINQNDVKQARDELLTLILAGYQTTAASLSFAWSLLAQYPEVEMKLQAEIQMVLGDRGLLVEDLPKFHYARSILAETLRLYPSSFGLIRQAIEKDVICGHKVDAGTVVCMAPYYTHRHPEFWRDPEKFDPDRFMSGYGCIKHRFAYVPFGGGPHKCLGDHFALLEALIILVMVSQRYRVRFTRSSFSPEVQALAMMKMKELPMQFDMR
jgi:cytochrome P450